MFLLRYVKRVNFFVNFTIFFCFDEITKMLEVLKSSFGQRARSTSTTSRLRDTMDNAAQASISMIQGYVKSVLQTDKQCIKRSICESASNAARESRELGNLIAQIGG